MKMEEIIIEREFQQLLPPLNNETYKTLEENIITNGCIYPLVVWKGILIDGHNRYTICSEHNIPFATVEKEFDSRDDVIIWIIGNQVARRNLTPIQLTYFRGLHYNTAKGKGGNPKGTNQYSEVESEIPTQPKALQTADFLSKQYQVHRDTIYSDAKVAASVDAIGIISQEAKSKILSGEVAINKQELQRLASAPKEEIKEVAEQIENGTYEKKKTDKAVKTDEYVRRNADEISIGIEDMTVRTDGAEGIYDTYDTSGTIEQTVNPLLGALTGKEFRTAVDAATKSKESQKKKALKAYIDTLTEIYAQL